MSAYPQILGVYSLTKEDGLGYAGTMRTRTQVTFWYARRLDEDVYEVQPLNVNHVPSGIKSTMGELEFVRQYKPEPGYYRVHTVPALKSLLGKIIKGEEFYDSGLLDKAEKEFIKALMIDESNVPASFGLGNVYAEKKDFHKLKKVLNILLNNDETFKEEQRQRFNAFGINLRRHGYYEESITYYKKSLEYDSRDEHLLFNLARALYENSELEKCAESLERALSINPDFREAQKFLRFCRNKLSGSSAVTA